MSLETEVRAIRRAVALSFDAQRVCLRLAGEGAAETLKRICPCDLYIRDGQMQHTLLLNDGGIPVADLYVCADGEDFLLLADGIPAHGLSERIAALAAPNTENRITVLTGDHVLMSLCGPYAWELLSEVISPEVIGLPYLGFFHGEGFTCLRAGITGEFSYDLLIHRDLAPKWRARILEMGAAFDLETAGPEAIDLCALESFFFNVRRDVVGDVTPLELQLQWRISYKKTYPGSEALLARRNRWTHRAVLVSSQETLRAGDRVFSGKREIGSLLHSGFSFDRGQWLGLALLDREMAYSGMELDCVSQGGNAFRSMTLSAPAINNRSLFVDPQRHNYATRSEKSFPPLVLSLPQ